MRFPTFCQLTGSDECLSPCTLIKYSRGFSMSHSQQSFWTVLYVRCGRQTTNEEFGNHNLAGVYYLIMNNLCGVQH